ncbi:MAG TPA: hypothetical protein VG317_06330 [Pseudonocardiaceae bacterium]|nr:hypothetical protein [Pseudonocardiaceae bacterium]
MAENEGPDGPAEDPGSSSHPARLPEPVNQQPLDAEQLRRFQEFQEFQQFQRFQQYLQATQGDGFQAAGGQPPPSPPPGQPLPYPPAPYPPAPTQPVQDVGSQLAGVQQQLVRLTETQIRIDLAVNPPWWRKLLRSRLIRWLVALLVLALIAIWGVPALIQHYFGGNSGTSAGTPRPNSVLQEHEYATGVYDAVQSVYKAVADPGRALKVCEVFSDSAQQQFATANHVAATANPAADCVQALAILRGQITDQVNYGGEADPNLRDLPEPGSGQQTFTVPSCWVSVSGGPALGNFTVTQVSTGQWAITGYTTDATCPPSAANTAPPTPTS